MNNNTSNIILQLFRMFSLLQSNVALQIFFAKLITTLFTPWTALPVLTALATLVLLITDTAYKTCYNTCTTYNTNITIKLHQLKYSCLLTMFIDIQFIDKSVVCCYNTQKHLMYAHTSYGITFDNSEYNGCIYDKLLHFFLELKPINI